MVRPRSHMRGALGPPRMIAVQPVKHLYKTLLGGDSLKFQQCPLSTGHSAYIAE